MPYLIFLMIFLSPQSLNWDQRNFMIVWNVGQGQWVSFVSQQSCDHFDSGGEKIPFAKIQKACSFQQSRFFYSHWDMDHLSGISKWPRQRVCIGMAPPGAAPSFSKAKMIADRSDCGLKELPAKKHSFQGNSSNERTHVYIRNNIFIPGDLPMKQEKPWLKDLDAMKTNNEGIQISDLAKVRILILGHHGSRTSTSIQLLNHLPGLQMTISSARFNRFHHPHAETLQRLRSKKIPQLRTEDWGTILFEL